MHLDKLYWLAYFSRSKIVLFYHFIICNFRIRIKSDPDWVGSGSGQKMDQLSNSDSWATSFSLPNSACARLTYQWPANFFLLFDESSYRGALWSFNRTNKIYSFITKTWKYYIFMLVFLTVQSYFPFHWFQIVLVKAWTLKNLKLLEFWQCLSSFSRRKQKIIFIFLTVF